MIHPTEFKPSLNTLQSWDAIWFIKCLYICSLIWWSGWSCDKGRRGPVLWIAWFLSSSSGTQPRISWIFCEVLTLWIVQNTFWRSDWFLPTDQSILEWPSPIHSQATSDHNYHLSSAYLVPLSIPHVIQLS